MEKRLQNDSISTVDGADDREAHPKFWIAAYTRPRSEKKAAAEISLMGIETYVPIQTVVRQWSDRKKKVDVVIIPNVMFAFLSDSEVITVKQHSLIVKVLSLPGQKTPAHIPAYQIDRLKFMLNDADIPVNFAPSVFKVNDNVRVVRGRLKGLVGSVERVSERKSMLTVAIDFLGGATVEISTSDLEVINN